jgi:hypothetical protein
MNILFSMLISFLFVHSALASSAKLTIAKSTINYQMETGFNLTKQAASEVLSKVKMEPKKRNDFYVDLYNGTSFLFDTSVQNYKLRLKSDQKKWTVQANTTKSSEIQNCSENLIFDVREKNIGELELSQPKAQAFEKLVHSQLDFIQSQDAAKVSANVAELQNFIFNLNIPLLSELLTVDLEKKAVLVATHMSKKTKWKALLLKNSNIQVSITESQVFIGSRFLENTYEVEFQVDEEGRVQKTDFAHAVCEFMIPFHFSAQDLNPIRLDPQSETLLLLKPFNNSILPN